ncbi:catechol 2,3-dioxygenase-like lactoylglutathione lyase family enzyme [Kribbella steppae]|uniref:Catechol 2,3-dioxygenase-like lactoylglutathione lyase family enzyme n=1 Tax=Kribbella steppae TaxID=2512223 RepID=A0A4R2H4V4_9ACTN|nr:VOC family protein [Kribbella steppae]TCO20449.1 catechol 2,3-dioxygenase-like lactoylglutathione lyase family enzyme [Kribbella steppae]
MIYELNHVGGRVRDLDASLAFYAGIGAEVVDRLFMTSSRVNRVHVQIATGLVELLHNEDPDPEASYGLNHVGFMTDDLDADYARLIGLGYAELSAPRTASSGQGRLAFLADPNGVRIELLQRSEEFRVPPIASGPVRRLSFIALAAPDLDAAIEFYGTHLGMERVESDQPTFRIGDDAVRLCESFPPAATPINHLGLLATEPRPDTRDPDGNRMAFVQS